MDKPTHTTEITRSYERILEESAAEERYIEIGGGHKIHVFEAGSGPPLVMLHGTGTAGYSLLPLLDHLEGVRAIVPDRPGNGLSDPVDFGHNGYRDRAVEVTGQMLDALGVDQISLGGNSGGSVWAIWYALAHPERIQHLILLGSVPLLPGTHAPILIRLMTTPIIGHIMARMPANKRMVVQLMGVMGEGETIVNHPKVLEALIATNNDPVASKAARTEFSAFLNVLGFRENMKIQTGDLAKLSMPTLVIWGDHDPLGGVDVARVISEAIPNCELEVLPAGHVPQLGHPDKAARLISDFVLSR
jgi:pimeloyl-ACP methyl ester carboxylesterase